MFQIGFSDVDLSLHHTKDLKGPKHCTALLSVHFLQPPKEIYIEIYPGYIYFQERGQLGKECNTHLSILLGHQRVSHLLPLQPIFTSIANKAIFRSRRCEFLIPEKFFIPKFLIYQKKL